MRRALACAPSGKVAWIACDGQLIVVRDHAIQTIEIGGARIASMHTNPGDEGGPCWSTCSGRRTA